KKIAEIRSLVVDTKERNKGIGKLLIQDCIEKAKKEKLREILSITDKVDFFKKCGFDTCLNKQYAMFVRLL
ncbi:MAG: GNAT family N-acetyltransferase, partial [Nitrosarchaeum sp.]|nr:GNAT family N-acetyltransferase [Nitrosarchaeum sp.]